jgi:hypothetical protein
MPIAALARMKASDVGWQKLSAIRLNARWRTPSGNWRFTARFKATSQCQARACRPGLADLVLSAQIADRPALEAFQNDQRLLLRLPLASLHACPPASDSHAQLA